MVYLHGGGFVMGGGVSYFFGPKLLVEKDVVLVTVQYRLGALGNSFTFFPIKNNFEDC
jgi:carboxylesterase type B